VLKLVADARDELRRAFVRIDDDSQISGIARDGDVAQQTAVQARHLAESRDDVNDNRGLVESAQELLKGG
jgi:hypothetical protein